MIRYDGLYYRVRPMYPTPKIAWFWVLDKRLSCTKTGGPILIICLLFDLFLLSEFPFCLSCFTIVFQLARHPQKCSFPLECLHPQIIYVLWTHSTQHSKLHLNQFTNVWATVCSMVHPMLWDHCLSVSPVCLSCLSVKMLVYCGQTVGWIKMKLGVEVASALATLC